MTRTIALLLGFFTSISVHSQTVGNQRPDRAIAPLPPTQLGKTGSDMSLLVYQSALTGYRPFRDEKVSSWQASNDNVGRIGGWRAYTREAREPDPVPAVGDTPAAAAYPHGGHGR